MCCCKKDHKKSGTHSDVNFASLMNVAAANNTPIDSGLLLLLLIILLLLG
ncbi:hypothetical protein BMG_5803 (plasmid) [Priestia megaterium]|nr:hypothetical protein BMG_5803 [Priestia megaterium]